MAYKRTYIYNKYWQLRTEQLLAVNASECTEPADLDKLSSITMVCVGCMRFLNLPTRLSLQENKDLRNFTLILLSQIRHVGSMADRRFSYTSLAVRASSRAIKLGQVDCANFRHYLVSRAFLVLKYCNLIGRARFLALPYKHEICTNLSRPSTLPKRKRRGLGARLLNRWLKTSEYS